LNNILTIIGLTETIAIIDSNKAFIPKKHKGKKARPFAIE
jgi:hypothetical protein